MKFYELLALFQNEFKKVKKFSIKSPALKYIIIAYNNVMNKIRDTYSDNEYVTERKINALEITDKMKAKLIKISEKEISDAMSEKIEEAKKIVKLKKDLNEILGIGARKSDKLIKEGLTSVKQLETSPWLDKINTDTKISLMHKPIKDIPYADVKELEPGLADYKPNKVMLVGSFRRHKPFMRDIDILFLVNTQQAETKDLTEVDNYLKYLKKIYNDNIWIYANGKNKISMVIQPTDNPDKKYKADIFITYPEKYYTTLLYTTGSRTFNINTRKRAKYLGCMLNQDGIYEIATINGKREKIKKMNTPLDDEKKLLAILGLEYVEPENRF
jgi:DNA polymerase/3'-5' exonuclease PolX